mgnify:CR=1 FL=1
MRQSKFLCLFFSRLWESPARLVSHWKGGNNQRNSVFSKPTHAYSCAVDSIKPLIIEKGEKYEK